jgi:hypothetical protein
MIVDCYFKSRYFFEIRILDVQGDHYMKFISIVLGLLVIISWLFVLREYQHGHEKTEKGKLVIIIACILTFIMTLINILD